MELNLNGNWKCGFSDGRELMIQVPGCWETYIQEKDIADKVRLIRLFEVEKLPHGRSRLCFGAVSYYCDIFLNGILIGAHEGMWDEFSVDTTETLREGCNELILDIWKPGYHAGDRYPLREVLSGFLPDVLCTFGGIWKGVRLETNETARGYFIDRHWGEGDGQGNAQITIAADLVEKLNTLHLTGEILDPDNICVAQINQKVTAGKEFTVRAKVAHPVLWSAGRPVLYRYRITVDNGVEKRTVAGTLGFREISAEGTKILLNKEPVYARGILHWGYYEKIIPTPDDMTVLSEIQNVKQYGFNMIKHCLYLPGENYLRIADETGMLLWIELPLWLPERTDRLEGRIRREFPAMLDQLAGHPSVVAVSLGCELDSKVDSHVLRDMYMLAKEKLHVLVRDNSGSGECYGGLAVDYADFSDYHFYAELQNMENLLETFTPVWKRNRPWVFGEFCDSDTLRDMQVLRNEKGVGCFDWEKQDEVINPVSLLKPDFFLGSHDERMVKSGIREAYPELKNLSYHHSMVHRKTTLEQIRAFPEIGGYNITSIRDVPIATSGLFDDFMRSKFDPQTFRTFNNEVMLLPAWDLTRIWLNSDRVMSVERYGFFSGERYGLHLLVSNYGANDLREPVITYELKKNGKKTVRQGTISGETAEKGKVVQTCYMNFHLPPAEKAENYILSVVLECGGEIFRNEWPVFLYPKPAKRNRRMGVFDPVHVFDTIENIFEGIEKTDGRNNLEHYELFLCSMLTPEIIRYAENGGAVFYVQRGEGSIPVSHIAFWREGMIRRFPHPLFKELEEGNWMEDLRYFSCATDTAFSDIADTRFHTRRPILRRYDCREWRADDYLMELGCGKGRIIATTLRLEGGMGKQPMFLENNRFGRYLLDKVCDWLLTGGADE